MADKVMRMSIPDQINFKNNVKEGIQRKESSNNDNLSTAPQLVNEVLNSAGKPLEKETRAFMEPRFGYDFSNVQIHNDSMAHQSSSEIKALAYTHGDHVVFGAGQYQPENFRGKQLLAHELMHVVQRQDNVIQRISIVDCDNKAQESKIDSADAKAVTILSKVIRILRSKLTPANKLIVDDLSNKYFKIKALNNGQTEFLINQYKNILDALISDAYRYECEDGSSFFDGCSDNTYAYVYPGWTNIHMCMNILKNKGTDTIAETIIHELSHVVDGTGDWRYCGIECTNDNIELGPVDLPFNKVSMDNADSFSNFALNLYLNGT